MIITKIENLPNYGLEFRLTTELNWKKTRREISAKTLLENWKIDMEHESDGNTNCNGCTRPNLQKCGTDFEIRERVETIQTTALMRSAIIIIRVVDTWGGLLSLRFTENPSAKAGVKNSYYN